MFWDETVIKTWLHVVETENSFVIQSQNLSPRPGMLYTGCYGFCWEFCITAKQIIVVSINLTTRFVQECSPALQILLPGAHDMFISVLGTFVSPIFVWLSVIGRTFQLPISYTVTISHAYYLYSLFLMPGVIKNPERYTLKLHCLYTSRLIWTMMEAHVSIGC